VACLESNGLIGLVHSDLEIIDDHGRVTGRSIGSDDRSEFAARFLRGHSIYPSAVLVRTELLRALGGFSEDFASAGWEDMELWTRLAERCQFHCIAEPLTSYRVHPANSTRDSVRRFRNQEIILQKLWARHEAQHRHYLRAEFARLYLHLGKALVQTGGVVEGRRYLKRAITLGSGGGVGLKTMLRACLRLGQSYLRPAVGQTLSSGPTP
jgi:GT2 family glycosyltransferase